MRGKELGQCCAGSIEKRVQHSSLLSETVGCFVSWECGGDREIVSGTDSPSHVQPLDPVQFSYILQAVD